MIELIIELPGIGRVNLRGETRQEIMKEAAFWNELPQKCPICKCGVRLQHRKAQGFDFYGLRCRGYPAHESNFGTTKEGLNLFYKGAGSWRDAFGTAEQDEAETPGIPADATPPAPEIDSTPSVDPGEAANPAGPIPEPPAPETPEKTPALDPQRCRDAMLNYSQQVGIIYDKLTTAEQKRWFTNLNGGTYPKEWGVETWKKMGGGIARYIKAMIRYDAKWKTTVIPYAVYLAYLGKLYPDKKPKTDHLTITGAEWDAMANSMEKWLAANSPK